MPELLEHDPADLDGEVTEFDPPRVLAYTWGDEHLRWELEPLPDGCRLALAHTFDERSGIPHPAGVLRRAARDASGWEVCLDSLEGILKGRQGEPGEQWQPLYERYVGKFSR